MSQNIFLTYHCSLNSLFSKTKPVVTKASKTILRLKYIRISCYQIFILDHLFKRHPISWAYKAASGSTDPSHSSLCGWTLLYKQVRSFPIHFIWNSNLTCVSGKMLKLFEHQLPWWAFANFTKHSGGQMVEHCPITMFLPLWGLCVRVPDLVPKEKGPGPVLGIPPQKFW